MRMSHGIRLPRLIDESRHYRRGCVLGNCAYIFDESMRVDARCACAFSYIGRGSFRVDARCTVTLKCVPVRIEPITCATTAHANLLTHANI